MIIYVPSRSRFSVSHTLDFISGANGQISNKVYLVVHNDQAQQYQALSAKHKVELLVTPDACVDIGKVRTWIGKHAAEQGAEKFVMIDDDCRFYLRENYLRKAKETSSGFLPLIYPADPKNTYGLKIQDLFDKVEFMLDHFHHGGVSMREQNQNNKIPVTFNTRICRFLAYRTDTFNAFPMDEVVVQEDFHQTLRMLKAGYANFEIEDWAQGQQATSMPGGCSDYRTQELHNAGIELLHSLHPDVTRIRLKENKTGPEELRVRKEITAYWKNAYKLSGASLPVFDYPTHNDQGDRLRVVVGSSLAA